MKKIIQYLICISIVMPVWSGASAQPCNFSDPFSDFGNPTYPKYPCGDIWSVAPFADMDNPPCEPQTNISKCAAYDFYVWSKYVQQSPYYIVDTNSSDPIHYQWYYNLNPVGKDTPYYQSPLMNYNDSVRVVMTSSSGRCNTTKTVIANYYPSLDNSQYSRSTLNYCAYSDFSFWIPGALVPTADGNNQIHYQWTLNNLPVGRDTPFYRSPVLKYNDSVNVTMTALSGTCNISRTKYAVNSPRYNITLAGDANWQDDLLYLMSDIPLIDAPLSLHWLKNGHEMTNPEIGGPVGDGSVLYTAVRFPKTSLALANNDQITLEIRDGGFCSAPVGTGTFLSESPYTYVSPVKYNYPEDGQCDISAISMIKYKPGTNDSVKIDGIIDPSAHTVTFNIDTNGYGKNILVEYINVLTTATGDKAWYIHWDRANYPDSDSIFKALANHGNIISIYISSKDYHSKYWNISINLLNGSPGK